MGIMENQEIIVEKLHSDSMINHELELMLGLGEIKLTLGGLMSLAIVHSPYLYGGSMDEESLAKAYTLIEHGDMDIMKFHTELQNELDSAFRVFEIIVPDDDPTAKKGKTSEIGDWSPEWFSDIISQACQSMPSLTYHQILNDMPLVAVFHLAVSTARRNGARTERPNDVRDAIKQLKEMRNKKKEGK